MVIRRLLLFFRDSAKYRTVGYLQFIRPNLMKATWMRRLLQASVIYATQTYTNGLEECGFFGAATHSRLLGHAPAMETWTVTHFVY